MTILLNDQTIKKRNQTDQTNKQTKKLKTKITKERRENFAERDYT